MSLSDEDHQMLLKHGKKLSDHERRITDLNNKMTDTLKSVDAVSYTHLTLPTKA